jgi:peroxiredoxin Q/BCP
MTSALSLIVGFTLIGPAPDRPNGATVGRPAPQFRLAGTDGRTYALSDFKGKRPVVLVWFPALDT